MPVLLGPIPKAFAGAQSSRKFQHSEDLSAASTILDGSCWFSNTEFVALLKKGIKGKADSAFQLDYFLKNFKHLDPKKRVTLVSKIGSQGTTLFSPEELVFKEDPATLLAANGQPVKGW